MSGPRLYPYQVEGARWLSTRRRAYLGDQMRLGKTIQAATAAGLAGAGSVLVVTPANAVENWRREWAVWGPPCRLDVRSWADPMLSRMDGAGWDLVIVDEAHYAKNPKAKRTAAVLDIARNAGRAWLLSGTPMPNHPGELYPVLRVLWPDVIEALGVRSYQHFVHKFCVMRASKWGPKPVALRPEAALLLKPHLKRIMIRRTVDAVGLELPPMTIEVSLLPRDDTFARELSALGLDPEKVEDRMAMDERRDCPRCKNDPARKKECAACDGTGTVSGSVSRLRRFLGIYKAPRIGAQLADELEAGAYGKVVVLAHHRAVLGLLRRCLDPFGVVGFDGSASHAARQAAVDAFRDGPARVFLGQQSAAGIAINLAAADEIVLVEPSFTPAENAQALQRIRHITKKRPVRGRLFGVAGSLDEGLMQSVVRKAKMQRELGL